MVPPTQPGADAGPAAPVARFKDLCIDAVSVDRSARFWSAVLGLTWPAPPGNGRLAGPTEEHTIWVNRVPEARTVKNRVHLDVHTGALTDLQALGASILEPAQGERTWTMMADPDGQEFCAFVRDAVPDYRLYELVIDCAEPEPIARWWAGVLGTKPDSEGAEWWIEVPQAPFEAMVFVPVPEPKTVKNRVHWDVYAEPAELIAAGARLLRASDDEIGWQVLADPIGNEFCTFAPPVR